MATETTPADLLDLKLLPAWVNEPARSNDYANFEGEEEHSRRRGGGGPNRNRERDHDRRGPRPRDKGGPRARDDRPRRPRPERSEGSRGNDRHRERERPEPIKPIAVTVRFLPHAPALHNVIAQIKEGSVAYSVFALARLFLEKPERYDVRLTTPEESPLHQLGETGAVASDRRILESSAFANARDDFYTVEVTQTEPLKGNFTNVARCRLSGTLLGPTNHHNYQPQLRNLYEARFSRRMSFADYQKQIDVVSDPAVVEEWKEQARSVTTYSTKNVEPPITFANAAEAERHFRQTHLPTLLRSAHELTIDGVLSRRLPDRALGRAIEDAWSAETRSPSKMMQELAAALRPAGLIIFRHRRGMLFVSPIRLRTFGHERAGVSASINGILERVAAAPGILRKQLSEQLAPAGAHPADLEKAKLALASDLHWLVSEGYVIEFNDGSLDLPRTKPPAAVTAAEEKPAAAGTIAPNKSSVPVQPTEEQSDESVPEQKEVALSATQSPAEAISAPAGSTAV
ncbi:MAG TPA: hypothetical protein VN921_04315 [Chthoniobacterales bacterium]|nr:hypothetical protein [Chthoniobacterales bacterium]